MLGSFIDLHIHLSLTDPHGVCGEAACLKLLHDAQIAHVQTIVITPHTDAFQPASVWQSDLSQTVDCCNRFSPDINIHTGSEFLIRHLADVLQVQQGQVPTINQTKHVLIEFLPDVQAEFISECVHELKIRGFTPVIAHPERYLTWHRSFDQLAQLSASGALLQGTMSALFGVHGTRVRQVLWDMLKSDLIDCIASDFHGGSYLEVVQTSVAQLTKQLGQAKVQTLLSDHPRRILTGT